MSLLSPPKAGEPGITWHQWFVFFTSMGALFLSLGAGCNLWDRGAGVMRQYVKSIAEQTAREVVSDSLRVYRYPHRRR